MKNKEIRDIAYEATRVAKENIGSHTNGYYVIGKRVIKGIETDVAIDVTQLNEEKLISIYVTYDFSGGDTMFTDWKSSDEFTRESVYEEIKLIHDYFFSSAYEEDFLKEIENQNLSDLIKLRSVDILTKEDIDLIDKLDNMRGSEISERVYNIAIKDRTYKKITEKVWEMLSDDNLPCSEIEYFEGLADEYEAEDEHDMWSACFYNCDLIYMQAIAEVLGMAKPNSSGVFLY